MKTGTSFKYFSSYVDKIGGEFTHFEMVNMYLVYLAYEDVGTIDYVVELNKTYRDSFEKRIEALNNLFCVNNTRKELLKCVDRYNSVIYELRVAQDKVIDEVKKTASDIRKSQVSLGIDQKFNFDLMEREPC